MNTPIEWLLEGNAWIRMRTREDILNLPSDNPEVVRDRQETLADPAIREVISCLEGWPVKAINSHKSAGHPLHMLTFLADLGLNTSDPGIVGILNKVMEHQDPAGPFQMVMNIPKHFGGSGEDTWSWGLCDAPLLVYALEAMGLEDHPQVQVALESLVKLSRTNGWPCAGAANWGTFRGPGRKQDPCPYANLVMLKALSLSETNRQRPEAADGMEAILSLWEHSYEHPYMFFMGTDFRKIKAPLVWYDLLHVLDVLSRFPAVRKDPRLLNMAEALRAKSSPEGKFNPESVWMAWKDWEFSDKQQPSRWLTLLAWRVLNRLDAA